MNANDDMTVWFVTHEKPFECAEEMVGKGDGQCLSRFCERLPTRNAQHVKLWDHVCLSYSKIIWGHLSSHWILFICSCTALKATGLLSCLQMKITSFGMKLKWMWHLREVRLEIPRRSPLSAEMNNASAWRIGVSVAQNVVHLGTTSLQR